VNTKRPKRHWLRRVLWGLLGFVVLLLAFHRPLLHGVIRLAAVKFAAKQHIALSLDVGGSIYSSLSLENVRASPTGPSPVEKISIEKVQVNYDLIGLARNGIEGFLKSYELKNATVMIHPVAAQSPSQKEDLGQTLSGIFQIPALYTDHIHIENLSLELQQPGGNLAVKNLTLTLDTDQPGVFSVAKIQIPQFRTWENLSATTSYTNRDLVIAHLNLDEDVHVDKVEMDASRRLEKINSLALNAHLFGGSADFSLFLHELGKNKADMKVGAAVRNVSVEKLGRYLDLKSLPSATFTGLALTVTGDPNVPASLNGSCEAEIDAITQGALKIDSVKARINANQSVATIETAEVKIGKNTITLGAKCILPPATDDLAAAEVDGLFNVDAPELARLSPQITAGSVAASGTFGLHNRKFTADVAADGKEIAAANATLSELGLHANLEKTLRSSTPFFDGLRTEIRATLGPVRYADYAIDSLTAKITSQEDRLQLDRVEIKRQTGDITLHGSSRLPRDNDFVKMPFNAEFAAGAPNVTVFYAVPPKDRISGGVQASGNFSSRDGVYNGAMTVKTGKLAFNDFAADGLDLEAAVVDNVAQLKSLNLALNASDHITASGKAELKQPYPYEGALRVNVRNLAAFNSILKASGVKQPIAGALDIAWQGSGQPGLEHHSGKGEVTLHGGQFGQVKSIEIAVAGNYTPEVIAFPTLRFSTNEGNLQARIDLKNSELSIHDILLQQGKTGLLSGSITLPLDLRTPKDVNSLVPENGRIQVNLVSKDLSIEPLLKPPAGGDAPAKGVFTTTVTADGSLDKPVANIHVEGRDLQAKAAAKLAPATLDLTLGLKDDQLTLNGTLRQPKINPLQVNGSVPLPVKKLIKEKKIDENSPVQLSVKLPRSSVGFISDLVPAIRFADGGMSIDAGVSGSIAHPRMSGSALLDLNAIRFLQANLPAVSGFKGDIRFDGNRLTFNRFGGDISGGPFNLAGTIRFANLAEPMQAVTDLKLTSTSALLLRNDTVTVRADSDIKISGPLGKAHVAGTVAVTKSKFFREIDILPLQLPGRPAPKPPEPPATVSFPNPPLRDMSFDIAIKSKDPFLIKGNMANGGATIDLKLGGTGLQPSLTGSVRIENFVASLPFSKLNISSGYVYFTEDNPFVPTLDMQGTTEMRDYNINVYISGEASNPQTVLSSEPPLPQEDIVSLLATGATSQELTGSGAADVLAGRAAALLFQKVYRKVFKQKAPSENESLADRISVNVGGVDPRTGKQELTTTLKLTQQYQLVGGLDVQGYLRGEVRYLLHFR